MISIVIDVLSPSYWIARCVQRTRSHQVGEVERHLYSSRLEWNGWSYSDYICLGWNPLLPWFSFFFFVSWPFACKSDFIIFIPNDMMVYMFTVVQVVIFVIVMCFISLLSLMGSILSCSVSLECQTSNVHRWTGYFLFTTSKMTK